MKNPFRLRQDTGIRRRLFLYLSAGLLSLWLLTAVGSVLLALHEINEMADAQMSQLASTLMKVSRDSAVARDAREGRAGQGGGGGRAVRDNRSREGSVGHDTSRDAMSDGVTEAQGNAMPVPDEAQAGDDDHGFAVWRADGALLMADRHGRALPFRIMSGFVDRGASWDRDAWRILYLHREDDGPVVAVAQRTHERLEILFNTVWVQLALSLLLLPVLLWLIAFAIRRGLRPLQQLAQELRSRDERSLQPVSEAVPAEILPAVQSLNRLLTRVSAAMAREARFTADAAHELRSPLAALKVQAEVLAMARSRSQQQHHLSHIQQSITRANRLTEQLLALSRLESLQDIPEAEAIDWEQLARQVLQGVNVQAREKGIRLRLEAPAGLDKALPMRGSPMLLQLMLRNLLDNAIRYSPASRQVTLYFDAHCLRVRDQGEGIAPAHRARIRERFYRPAGQAQQGSGLGLSIVERIATLHGLVMTMEHPPEGGLQVTLQRAG